MNDSNRKAALDATNIQSGKADKQIEQAVICPNYTR